MAKAKRKTGGRRSRSGATRRGNGNGNGSRQQDAISLLKADHRQVEEWFEEFESARNSQRKQELVRNICMALTVHTQIEEQLFYPAFLEATGDEDIHHEAEIEHEGAKRLIADIENSGMDDDYLDARVSVLSEMIKHHVREEEKRDGMFAKARSSEMDLEALGEQLLQLKQQLMPEGGQRRGSRRGAQPHANV
jgi:hemerythrin superfamily protein